MDSDRGFRIVWISQSDGKLEWRNPKTSQRELNAPPKLKQLNSHKGEMGYEELGFNDKRHREWRKKLGTLLIQDEIEKRRATGQDIADLGQCCRRAANYSDFYRFHQVHSGSSAG